MKFTKEHLLAGMSSNGFWSNKQLNLLDVNFKESGWKYRAIGKDLPSATIEKFIALKDAHLVDGLNIYQRKGKNRKKKKAKEAQEHREINRQTLTDLRGVLTLEQALERLGNDQIYKNATRGMSYADKFDEWKKAKSK